MKTAELNENAKLALDTIMMRKTQSIPTGLLHLMDIPLLEELGGHQRGEYLKSPEDVYLDCQKSIGVCMIDQYIPRNPLTMSQHGFDSSTARTPTTGLEKIVIDGVLIDSPEAVVEHLERFVFPSLQKRLQELQASSREEMADNLIQKARDVQKIFGSDILKVPYGTGFNNFPMFRYGTYGYENYFMAYALYPEVMEKDFALQADVAEKRNQIAVLAYKKGNLPPLLRLDHDMADSRGTLVNINSLDKIWFPHFARAIKPYVEAGIKLIWHCDGNLMEMVPRLIEAGISGFQGFQYEAGMDYEAICRMKDREGNTLFIWAGVSVTKTLPHGTESDVKRELTWLVEKGPPVGLLLGASSSITPGTNLRNIKTLIEGLKYYRTHGRK